MTRYSRGDYLSDNDINYLHDILNGRYKITGFNISKSATLSIAVGPGSAVFNGTVYKITSSGTFSLVPDGTYPRKAILTLNSAGSLSLEHGFPSQASPLYSEGKQTKFPIAPTASSNSVLLTEIYIPAGVSDSNDCDFFIYDFTADSVHYISNSRTSSIPLFIKGISGQSADYIKIVNEDDVELFKIDSTGEAHGSMIAAGDVLNPDLGEEGTTSHFAVDEMGRMILSPVDFSHFGEKAGWNTTNHYWCCFPGYPLKDWEIWYTDTISVEWEQDSRWSAWQGWLHVHSASGGTVSAIFAHQPFRNGKTRFRLRTTPVSVDSVSWKFGMFEYDGDRIGLPGEWVATSSLFGAQYFIEGRYTGSGAGIIQAVVQNRNSGDSSSITALWPSDCDTNDFIVEIEKYEDVCRFWLYTGSGGTTAPVLLFASIPGVEQNFAGNPVVGLGIRNYGNTGSISTNYIAHDPHHHFMRTAPKKSANYLITSGASWHTILAESNPISGFVAVNTASSPSVLFVNNGAGITIWSTVISASSTEKIDYPEGMVSRWGASASCTANTLSFFVCGGLT